MDHAAANAGPARITQAPHEPGVFAVRVYMECTWQSGLISGRAPLNLCRGWPDEACEGRDFWPWDAEACADEFVERQLQLHAGFVEPQHNVARVATHVADGPAGDFSFGDEGADVVFGCVGVERNFWA